MDNKKKRSRGVEIAFMFEQLKEKHLAKKQEWYNEKENLKKQLIQAEQQIRLLKNLPKELEDRYRKLKNYQEKHADIQEQFDTERLKWELDKNYLKQMIEKLRSDLKRNLCYVCKCPLNESEEAYYRDKSNQNEERLVRQLEELEEEKRNLMTAHRRDKDRWNNEKRVLRQKIQRLNVNIDKAYTSPLVLHGSHLSSNSPYSSLNRQSSVDYNDFISGNSRSSQEQGFQLAMDELLQHIKQIDDAIDCEDESYQNQTHKILKNSNETKNKYHQDTKPIHSSSKNSNEFELKSKPSNSSYFSSCFQNNFSHKPFEPSVSNPYISNKRNYNEVALDVIPDVEDSELSSPTSCSLPPFSDSGESETTAFTTPLPFLRQRCLENDSRATRYYSNFQRHHPRYNANYPFKTVVHEPLKESPSTSEQAFMKLQKLSQSPKSPSNDTSACSTPGKQRKTLSTLHQQLLFRKQPFNQSLDDFGSPLYQQKSNYFNDVNQKDERNKSDLIDYNEKAEQYHPISINFNKEFTSKSISKSDEDRLYVPEKTQSLLQVNNSLRLDSISKSLEGHNKTAPKIPPKPSVSIEELIQGNKLTQKIGYTEKRHLSEGVVGNDKNSAALASMGRSGTTWVKKRLPFLENKKIVETKIDSNKKQLNAEKSEKKLKKASKTPRYETDVNKRTKRYTRSKTEAHRNGLSSDEDNPNEESKITKNVKLRRHKTAGRSDANANRERRSRRQSIKSEYHIPITRQISHSSDEPKKSGKEMKSNSRLSNESLNSIKKKLSGTGAVSALTKKVKEKNESLVQAVVAKLNSINDSGSKIPKLEKPVKKSSSLRDYLNTHRRKTDGNFTPKTKSSKSDTKKTTSKTKNETKKNEKKSDLESQTPSKKDDSQTGSNLERRWSVVEPSESSKPRSYRRTKTQYLNEEEDKNEKE